MQLSRKFSIGLLIASAVTFVAAKNITTAAEAKIDDIVYWIIGVIPIMVFPWLYFFFRRNRKATAKQVYNEWFGFVAHVWFISLFVFVVFRLNGIADVVEAPFYATFEGNYALAHLSSSIIYSTFSTIAVTIAGVWLKIYSDAKSMLLPATFAILCNTISFYGFVFVLTIQQF